MYNAVVLGWAGVLKPGKLRWLRTLLWAVLLFGLLLLPQIAIPIGVWQLSGIPLQRFTEAPPGLLLGWTTLWALVAIGLYAGLVILGEKRQPSELELQPALPELGAGLVIGAAMMSVAVALMWAAGGITIGVEPMRDPLRALALSIQSGVMEEITFRLIVLRLIWRAFGLEVALALSAILFGAAHIANPNASWFAAFAIAIEAGVMLAGFYILTGRIWAAIGVHAGWNFTQGWIYGAAVSGTSGFEGGPLNVEPVHGVSEVISGGGFGPEASFAGLLVGTGVGALTLWLAWKRGILRGVSAPPDEAVVFA